MKGRQQKLIKVKGGRIEVSGDKEELILDLGSIMLSLVEYTNINIDDLETLIHAVVKAQEITDFEDDEDEEPEDFTSVRNWSGLAQGLYNALSEEDQVAFVKFRLYYVICIIFEFNYIIYAANDLIKNK